MHTIIAHRGASAYFLENTLASIQEAIDQRADMVEIDVQTTKDSIPVVFHDYYLKRLAKKREYVKNLDYVDIKDMKIKNNEQIPTLEQVLDLCRGKIKVNIEVKSPDIEPIILNMIQKNNMEKDILISSKKLYVLEKFKEIAPDLKRAFIFKLRSSGVKKAHSIGCYSVHPHHLAATRWMIVYAKNHNMKIFPYTVNRSKRMRQLIKAGVDGLITDKPVLFRNVLRELENKD